MIKNRIKGQSLRQNLVRPYFLRRAWDCAPQAGQALRQCSGQAAILIIFVIGMVSLLIGMSLSKTGFEEGLMGRRIANSTAAFYVSNSGVEDAFYRIRQEDFDDTKEVSYDLPVGDGKAKVSIKKGDKCSFDEIEIESVGKYGNFIRRLRVCTFNSSTKPGFIHAIQAGAGGVELGNRLTVSGRDKITGQTVPGDVYSNSFVRGENNGREGSCVAQSATTRINGTVWAGSEIEGQGSGDGPCIEGNAYAGNLKECRVLGSAYSGMPVSIANCPYKEMCDPLTDSKCKIPPNLKLPDIGLDTMKRHLQDDSSGNIVSGDCEVGGANDCTKLRSDGKRSLGGVIITGDLTIISDFFVSGPIWVQGNIKIMPNQTIGLVPEIQDYSQVILADGKIISSSNVEFTSNQKAFLLFVSEYENIIPVCDIEDDAAIQLSANINSILFYATRGCVVVGNPTAKSEFYGAVLGVGIKIKNNSDIIYDPALKNAVFSLTKSHGWPISSFTEF